MLHTSIGSKPYGHYLVFHKVEPTNSIRTGSSRTVLIQLFQQEVKQQQ